MSGGAGKPWDEVGRPPELDIDRVTDLLKPDELRAYLTAMELELREVKGSNRAIKSALQGTLGTNKFTAEQMRQELRSLPVNKLTVEQLRKELQSLIDRSEVACFS